MEEGCGVGRSPWGQHSRAAAGVGGSWGAGAQGRSRPLPQSFAPGFHKNCPSAHEEPFAWHRSKGPPSGLRVWGHGLLQLGPSEGAKCLSTPCGQWCHGDSPGADVTPSGLVGQKGGVVLPLLGRREGEKHLRGHWGLSPSPALPQGPVQGPLPGAPDPKRACRPSLAGQAVRAGRDGTVAESLAWARLESRPLGAAQAGPGSRGGAWAPKGCGDH